MRVTPAELHVAISFKNLDAVIKIVSIGNIYNELFRGITPVSLAIYKKAFNILEFLVKKGANVNIRTQDDKMEPPLFTACRLGYLEAVKILLKSPNLDVDQKDFFGRTPLWAAAGSFYFEIVELLLNSGATVNVNVNPLVRALKKSSSDHRIIHILIRRGCKIDFDLSNQSITLPSRNCDLYTLTLLVSAGCDIRKFDGFQNYRLLPYLQNDKQLYKWIDSLLICPKTLQHLTTCFIRELLVKCNKNIFPKHVDELPLPKQLKGYILLEH